MFQTQKTKFEIATLDNFGKNVKYLLDDMSYNYTIIIDKGEYHEDYACQIFRALLSGTNSTFNCFIEIKKDDWDTVSEILASDLIRNATEKYNNTVSAK